MRYDKASLTSSPIFPDKLVTMSNGNQFYACKGLDGEYYGSKTLGGQVVNISQTVLRSVSKADRDGVLDQIDRSIGDQIA